MYVYSVDWGQEQVRRTLSGLGRRTPVSRRPFRRTTRPNESDTARTAPRRQGKTDGDLQLPSFRPDRNDPSEVEQTSLWSAFWMTRVSLTGTPGESPERRDPGSSGSSETEAKWVWSPTGSGDPEWDGRKTGLRRCGWTLRCPTLPTPVSPLF